MKLIALEIFLGFGVPLTWATWELVSLRREQRRDREKAQAEAERAALLEAGRVEAERSDHVDPRQAPR